MRMSDQQQSATNQWNLAPDESSQTTTPGSSDSSPAEVMEDDKEADCPKNDFKLPPDTMKRRGFFEAIKHRDSPMQHLAALLQEYEQQARQQMEAASQLAEKKTQHLQQRVAQQQERIEELKLKLGEAAQYKEADDPVFQGLLQELTNEEAKLLAAQQRLTEVRIKLGEAKAGIIHKSLEEAETQVKSALHIQTLIYDETRQLNQKKFADEKDHLTHLADGYRDLYQSYEKRYKKTEQYLMVLDVDGISPITTQILTTVGTVSFGVAGFFFSTFAGNAGFGNQDMLYFVFRGILDTAKTPTPAWLKILILMGLIALVTLVSMGCHYLIQRLKRNSGEDVLSEMNIAAALTKKMRDIEYEGRVSSNNWYGFWLQLIPGLLIAGLLILGIARKSDDQNVNAINASSEGLIVGSGIAIAFAGLIYLYIIKIVEPRLVKRYTADPNTQVNWIRSNWELVAIATVFLCFLLGITVIPYEPSSTGVNIIPLDKQTRFAILLFVAICLTGSTSFAYSVRSRGLIETGRYMERVLRRIKQAIAYCSSAEAPELNNKVAEEHGNIIQHVLRQLSFKATIDKEGVYREQRIKKESELGFWEKLFRKKEAPVLEEPDRVITITAPWEEQYFPHLVDELKAVDFEYISQKKRTDKAADALQQYRTTRQTHQQLYAQEISACQDRIAALEEKIETAYRQNVHRRQQITNTANVIIVDILDGFHLGLWYRENGMGPGSSFFDPVLPTAPTPLNLFSAQ
jgi:hypothetical protein